MSSTDWRLNLELVERYKQNTSKNYLSARFYIGKAVHVLPYDLCMSCIKYKTSFVLIFHHQTVLQFFFIMLERDIKTTSRLLWKLCRRRQTRIKKDYEFQCFVFVASHSLSFKPVLMKTHNFVFFVRRRNICVICFCSHSGSKFQFGIELSSIYLHVHTIHLIADNNQSVTNEAGTVHWNYEDPIIYL